MRTHRAHKTVPVELCKHECVCVCVCVRVCVCVCVCEPTVLTSRDRLYTCGLSRPGAKNTSGRADRAKCSKSTYRGPAAPAVTVPPASTRRAAAALIRAASDASLPGSALWVSLSADDAPWVPITACVAVLGSVSDTVSVPALDNVLVAVLGPVDVGEGVDVCVGVCVGSR